MRVTTGIHRMDDLHHHHGRPRVPFIVKAGYGFGVLAWMLPIGLALFFRANPTPASSTGWRVLGVLLAVLLALVLHSLSWAGAFFYSRFVTADQIADEAERGTGAGTAVP